MRLNDSSKTGHNRLKNQFQAAARRDMRRRGGLQSAEAHGGITAACK